MRARTSVADGVPTEDIARAVLNSGRSLSEICRNLGWIDRNGNPSTSRLQRRLGLMPSYSKHKGKIYRNNQRIIGYELAVEIVRAADVDPVDAGL